MKIWLIDATTYRRSLSPLQIENKRLYFRIKNYVKNHIVGPHEPPGQKCYSAGVLRIATILRHNGYDTEYIPLAEIDKMIENSERGALPDIVGFGAVTPTVPVCAHYSSLLKSSKNGIRIVLGGAHAHFASKTTMAKYPVFDEIVPDCDMVAAAKIIQSRPKDLSNPPLYIDYKILPEPLHNYCVNLFTSSGCKYHCGHCQDGLAVYNEYALDGGLSEVLVYLKPKTTIHYCDSVLGGSEKRAVEVCKKISSIKHNMLLSCDLRSEFISSELVENLVNAGFVELRMGLLSTDRHVLNNINRGGNPDKILETIKLIRKISKIYISIYITIGLPGSTTDAVDQLIRLVKHLLEKRYVDEVKCNLYVPYPNDDNTTSPIGVHIQNEDWTKYDRQSYPVYGLSKLTSDDIWNAFQKIEGEINISWDKAYELSRSGKIPDTCYPEYIISCYKL
ncbi:B12-binding domain-containing radical SAM protein [Candidatus Magnetominusculus dajiuhuensis]|uniref:B12-binding domain-containing radical SAM protein n=1 Tax=Candidatus Magnetominusculus dajiuhuensis TaxID=3137712 RepID=UPI003B4325FD